MKQKYDVALMEKPLDEGLTKTEICDLYDMLSGVEGIPVDIQGEYSAAMGFITTEIAEQMDYDISALTEAIQGILNDMENESAECEYVFYSRRHTECHVWLSR